jgi:hypothetical protein
LPRSHIVNWRHLWEARRLDFVIPAGFIVIFVYMQLLHHQRWSIFVAIGGSTDACMLGWIRRIYRQVYPAFEIARSRKSTSTALTMVNRLQDKVSDPSAHDQS